MTEQEFTAAFTAALEPLMQKIESLKQTAPEAPAPDLKAIAAAEKAKTVAEIKDWSGKQSKI